MTIHAQFVWGVWLGVLTMQAAHGLYLRNTDYALAFVATFLLGGLGCLLASDLLD